MENSKFYELGAFSFNQVESISIKIIRCGLISLDSASFQSKNVTNIYETVTVPRRTIGSTLRLLNLVDNRLRRIRAGTFDGLRYLDTLDLGWNRLTTLDDGVFDSLTSLIWLGLQRNRLTSVTWRVFGVVNSRLTRVTDFTDNPLVCSCGMKWLAGVGADAKSLEKLFPNARCEYMDLSVALGCLVDPALGCYTIMHCPIIDPVEFIPTLIDTTSTTATPTTYSIVTGQNIDTTSSTTISPSSTSETTIKSTFDRSSIADMSTPDSKKVCIEMYTN